MRRRRRTDAEIPIETTGLRYPGKVAEPALLRVDYAPGYVWDGLGAAAAEVVPRAA